jgi:hypothetical protein
MKKIELVKHLARNETLENFIAGKILVSPEMCHAGWYINLSAIKTTFVNEYNSQTITAIDVSTCKTAMLLTDDDSHEETIPQIIMCQGQPSYAALRNAGWTDAELVSYGFAYYDTKELEKYHV